MNVTESASNALAAAMLEGKRTEDYAVMLVATVIESWGRIILRIDQEPAIRALASAVKAKRSHETIIEHAPRRSHSSVGEVESSPRTRALKDKQEL